MTPEAIAVRQATAADADLVAAIFNQGIEDRVATFETREQAPERVTELIAGRRVVLVAERDGEIVGFAWVGPYDAAHHYYDGVGEATMYVERSHRRSGIGRVLIDAVADAASEAGFHKLVGKVFTSNEPSIAMLRACGWREVGVHHRHGCLDGDWKDVVVVELLLAASAG
jgi:L-amino acid N-acyltransferase YncA